MSSDPPPHWKKEVGDAYAPIRVIGKGGFASVWMAKEKATSGATGGDGKVAIKVMRDDGYARREIAILSELTAEHPHPNVVRLLRDFKPDPDYSEDVNCVVLSLARGPTLTFILNKGGALGLVVAQSISRQLIDTVAFLHGHAGEFQETLLCIPSLAFSVVSQIPPFSHSQGHPAVQHRRIRLSDRR